MSFDNFKKKLIYKYYFLLDPFFKIIPQNKNKNKNTFIIFSEARSGTTWLAELLRDGLGAVIFWEPLHPKRGLITSKYGRRPYWHEANRSDLKNKLQHIFLGKGINSWTSRMEKNIVPFYTASKPQLIKFTRINRLLPELLDYFEFENKPVLLIRHPAGVFLSQFVTFGEPKKGFYWTEDKKYEILKDPRYLEHKVFIDKQDKLIYKEFAVFCMNNYHIYNTEVYNDKYFLIFYEELCLNPIKALQNVILSWKINENKIKTSKHNFSQVDNTKQKLDKWETKLSKDEKNIFQQILDYFDIRIYSMKKNIPIKYK